VTRRNRIRPIGLLHFYCIVHAPENPVSVIAQKVQGRPMNIHISLGPMLALIAGILILLMPKLLNYIVALYLILLGLVGLFGASGLYLR
jgi:Protein of unknown function (DUF3096)/Calcium-activated potassium channel, beta subunit